MELIPGQATADTNQRLFTAIALPAAIQQQLLQLAPRPQRNIRRVAPAQMHLTLCFIGQARVETVDPLLASLAGQFNRPATMQLRCAGVGKFGSNARGCLLWAGIAAHPGLLQLQAQMARALQPCLAHPDHRPYRPHITLARCQPGAAETTLDAFLRQATPPELSFPVASFGLYSSITASSGPVYRCEQTYPLAAAAEPTATEPWE